MAMEKDKEIRFNFPHKFSIFGDVIVRNTVESKDRDYSTKNCYPSATKFQGLIADGKEGQQFCVK